MGLIGVNRASHLRLATNPSMVSYSKVTFSNQFLEEKVFASHKVLENPHLAIVYSRGLGPKEIPTCVDFQIWPLPVGFGNPHFCGFVLKSFFSQIYALILM